MLNKPTMGKLYAMRLAAMAAAWQQQHGDANAAELGFDDRFTLLVEAEHLARDNRKLDRLLKQAQLRIADACVEDVDASGASGPGQSNIATDGDMQLGARAFERAHLGSDRSR